MRTFKVGDRIRFYDYKTGRGAYTGTGTITAIGGDGVLYHTWDGVCNDAASHPKQCRKLKNKHKCVRICCPDCRALIKVYV